MNRLFCLVLSITLLVSTASARADNLRDDDWSFNFFNDSRLAVTQINTMNRNGKWSRNWLRSRMSSGTGLTLSFYDKSDNRCEVRTYVKFTDDSFYDEVIDYCGIAIVRVTDRELTTE